MNECPARRHCGSCAGTPRDEAPPKIGRATRYHSVARVVPRRPPASARPSRKVAVSLISCSRSALASPSARAARASAARSLSASLWAAHSAARWISCAARRPRSQRASELTAATSSAGNGSVTGCAFCRCRFFHADIASLIVVKLPPPNFRPTALRAGVAPSVSRASAAAQIASSGMVRDCHCAGHCPRPISRSGTGESAGSLDLCWLRRHQRDRPNGRWPAAACMPSPPIVTWSGRNDPCGHPIRT